MSILQDLLDLIYPITCPGCGMVMSSRKVWCDNCLRDILNPRLLNSSFTEYLHGCYTICNYEKSIRKCIIQIKYSRQHERKRFFTPLLDYFPYWDRLTDCDLVIPVPLSKKKMNMRGYNQVDLMFKEPLEKRGMTYAAHGLVRICAAETQSLLTRNERLVNTKNVFHVNKGMDLKGKRILVVDDIYTTGATMNSCAKELKRVGAEEIIGLTIASGAY